MWPEVVSSYNYSYDLLNNCIISSSRKAFHLSICLQGKLFPINFLLFILINGISLSHSKDLLPMQLINFTFYGSAIFFFSSRPIFNKNLGRETGQDQSSSLKLNNKNVLSTWAKQKQTVHQHKTTRTIAVRRKTCADWRRKQLEWYYRRVGNDTQFYFQCWRKSN